VPSGLWNSGVDLTIVAIKSGMSMQQDYRTIRDSTEDAIGDSRGIVGRQLNIDGVGEVIVPSELGLAIPATGTQAAIMTVTDSHL
jgi:hypothetical protein